MRPLFVLLAFASPVCAQDWPPEVAAIIDEAGSVCEGSFTAPAESVTQRDLNGDGNPDWVIDSSAFQCSDSLGTYCGTGGCAVDTLIDGTRGALLLHEWDTVTDDGTTYLSAPNDQGETVRFLWSGSEWQLQ
ncbi:MAG: hypothetical protein J0L76_06780 [Rhodobacterales bacterium]|nr:hypothetical protein [Rhodobacterales bacterium]